MTFEELFNVPPEFKSEADWFESMSDEQLEAHFAPVLNVTRPERQTQDVREQAAKNKTDFGKSAKAKQAADILKQFGLKL